MAVEEKTREDLIQLLQNAGAVFKGNATKCVFPDHNDKNASAGIYEKDGKWRYFCQRCQKGGDYYDMDLLLGGEGLKRKEFVQQKKYSLTDIQNLPKEDITLYRGYENQIEMIIVRGKVQKANPFSPYGNVFVNKFPPKRPIMNKPTIKDSDVVLVVEGEKCVKWAHSYGIPATTSSGGSASANKSDWRPLKGKNVVIWPDMDEAGEKYANDVKKIIITHAKSVSVIDPYDLGLKKGDDIVEYTQNLGAMSKEKVKEHILDLMACAPKESVTSGYLKYIDGAVKGKYSSLIGPHAYSQISKYLLRGTVTTVCANGGSGKSWFVGELLNHFLKTGVKASAYMLEEDLDYWISRSIAQVTDLPDWCDPDWLSTPCNAKTVSMVLEQQEDYIATLTRNITTLEEGEVTHKDVLEWIMQKCEDGVEFLVIDPVTAISHKSNKPWEEDLNFVLEVKRLAKRFNIVIYLVTHPKSGSSEKFTLDSMAGSMAYNRFVQNIIWLIKIEQKEYEMVSIGDPNKTEVLNRALIFLKGRNNKMQHGNMVGFEFMNLKFVEKGAMKPLKGSK